MLNRIKKFFSNASQDSLSKNLGKLSLVSLSDKDARANFANNAGARWFKAGADTSDGSGCLAVQKIKNNRVFLPEIRPGYSIEQSWKLFAIGSCFARGVEKALMANGFDVLSAANDFDEFELASPDVTPLGFTNKYTTCSILNELRWSLVPNAAFPRDSIVAVKDGLYIDPHTNPALKLADLPTTLYRREKIFTVNRRIKDCQLVVLTLGLVECWYDTLSSVYLNITPTPDMFSLYPNRYNLHVLGYEENMKNMNEIYEILQKYGHPNLHIIVTVSPVPLLATFTDRDVVVANTFSKSVLRVVAEEWAAGKANVNYFPSYEMVMNSQREVTWADDLRHVQGEVVQSIMGLLKKSYIK
jgi:hypothetical protein